LRKPKLPDEDKRLTNVELELMTILWSLGEGNVAQVIAALPAERGVPVAMVRQLIENVRMSDDDVRELRKLVAGLKDRK
jgi:hypothetical protein